MALVVISSTTHIRVSATINTLDDGPNCTSGMSMPIPAQKNETPRKQG
jgi:hypothetical protein